MGKQEDHERKRSKTIPKAKKKPAEEGTLIDRVKLTNLMLELENFRRKHELVPVEYEFLLQKSLEIMKECNRETYAMVKEIEKRKMIVEAIRGQQQEVKKQNGKNGGMAKHVS